MPGWHEATKALRGKGAFQTVGIIQEQHPDRCQLFMQWKQLDFPVLVDSLNRLGVNVVPLTIAVDEHGIVRHVGLSPNDLENEFLSKTYPSPKDSAKADRKTAAVLGDIANDVNTSEAWMNHADALILEGGLKDIDTAISDYQSAIALDRTNGPAYFRAGVAYRMRYDQREGAVKDFQLASQHWGMALEVDPNQYIWRRRIQQYGPRLDKPYPFYDWIRDARGGVIRRGEKPVVLMIEPRGTELAQPAKEFATGSSEIVEPDPRRRIERDRKMVAIEMATVPAIVDPDGGTRVHMTLRLNRAENAHWNNETGPMEIWISPPQGWEADPQLIRPKLARAAQTSEVRFAEFELKVPSSARPGTIVVPGYMVYYVCRGKDGACLYRRQDFIVSVNVR